MINNAYDLYQFLIKYGGLKPYQNSYDINFKESLKTEFNLKIPKDLINITVEEFLIFFFNSSEVYNVMMSDVIDMFKRAKATAEEDKNNIKLDIIFDRIKDKLKIDLSGFIEKYNNSQVIVRKSLPVFKNYSNIWGMAKILYSIVEVNKKKQRPEKREYCYILSKSKWEQFNSFEESNNTELNRYVNLLKLVLDKYYYTLDRYLSKGRLELDDNSKLVALKEFETEKVDSYIFNNLTLSDFCRIEMDYFTSTVVKYLKIVVNNKEYQDEVLGKLKSFFSELEFISIEEKINLFKEYLKLPIWKLRHELYSIWVMSQIVDISNDFEINTQQGKLLFAFKATHQARLKYKEVDMDLSIDLWSELKTKTNIPLIGKGRSKAIQPDYTIVQGDNAKADDAIVVVECKQYKKGSYSNFSKALVDYSNVHQNAYVFLVNYGSLTSNFESKFFNNYPRNSSKSIAIGDFNPMFPNIIKEFKDSFREELFKKFPRGTKSNAVEKKKVKNSSEKMINNVHFEFKEGFQIRLTWSEVIQDLDLYLKYDELIVFYDNRNLEICGNTITFGNDLMTIPVSNPLEYETINVIGDLQEDFLVYVKRYSTESVGIGKSKAIVEIIYNNTVYHRFECPESNNTDVWDVFQVENGKLFEIKQ